MHLNLPLDSRCCMLRKNCIAAFFFSIKNRNALRHFSREDKNCVFKKPLANPHYGRMDCIATQHANDVTVGRGSLISYTRFRSLTV